MDGVWWQSGGYGETDRIVWRESEEAVGRLTGGCGEVSWKVWGGSLEGVSRLSLWR